MVEGITIIHRDKVLKLLKEIEVEYCRCDTSDKYNRYYCDIHEKIEELKYMIGLGN